MSWLPAVVSMGTHATVPRGVCADHVHDHDEVCLVADGACTIVHAGVARRAEAGTTFLFRAGEVHGYRNDHRQAPVLWVVHYRRDSALDAAAPLLAEADPERRVLHLDAARQDAFRGAFLRLLAEHALGGDAAPAAAASWLRLLLIGVARWSGAGGAPPLPVADAGVARLWRYLHEHCGEGPQLDRMLGRRIPGYDALRHRFVAQIGHSPTAVLARLRLLRAQHLLLETSLPIAAIAAEVGYARQHEFARAFRRATGVPPTAWRKRPQIR